jgi:hypothetical protein
MMPITATRVSITSSPYMSHFHISPPSAVKLLTTKQNAPVKGALNP